MTSSSVQTRKERERVSREKLIVSSALEQIRERGVQDLNIDELARSVEYSKGTVYLHFTSKEDILLAAATAILRQRAALFEKAITFVGSSRERARCIGFACCHFMVDHPDYFRLEMALKDPSYWEKASQKRREEHGFEGARVVRSMLTVVNSGVEAGDLPKGINQGDVVFGLAAVTMGSHLMAQIADFRMLTGVDDPVRIVRYNQDVYLDGLNWKALSSEFDYNKTDERIRKEIFLTARV
jgi:AcrR family transcriptional regulator